MMGYLGRNGKFARGLLLSLRILAGHRLRTALSVSGLLVGIAAVIVMVAIGEGTKRQILTRLQAMGTNLLVVSAAPAPGIAGRPRQVAVNTLLSAADASVIVKESAFAIAAAPSISRSLVLRWQDRNVTTALTGTTAEGLRIRNIQVGSGRLFDEGDDQQMRRVMVLGPTAARNLFAGADPIGRAIRIGNALFEVIGVARPRGIDPVGTDLDDMAMIPLQTAARRVLNVPYVHAIFVQARSSADLMTLERDVREILRSSRPERSGIIEPFIIQNQAALLRTERAAAQVMNQLIIGVAVLALLLGGIGILAVMLIAVRERMQEIGLRRAVGARRRDILAQFLSEAVLLAGAGGLSGVLTGASVALAIPFLGLGETVISSLPATVALLVSVSLGIVCGIYPALRAARMNPIDALRPK